MEITNEILISLNKKLIELKIIENERDKIIEEIMEIITKYKLDVVI